MKTLKLYMGETLRNGSIILARPNNNYYILGENYRFSHPVNNITFPLTLVHKEIFELGKMSNLMAYLLNDVHAKLKIEMLVSWGYSLDTEFCFMVFSSYAFSVRTFGINPDFETLRIEQKFSPRIDE